MSIPAYAGSSSEGGLPHITTYQWRTIVVAMLGYTLDAMDFLLYALVIPFILKDFHLNAATAGFLASATFLAAAVGGYIFGILTDYVGRSKMLIITVLIYSAGTFGAAFSGDWIQLLFWRMLLGLGMGGEWGPGMTLVMESWPSKYRTFISCVVQCAWSFGYLLAVAASLVVVPHWGWRGLFMVGVVPAVIVSIVRARLTEPEIWEKSRQASKRTFSLAELFTPRYLRHTVLMSLAMITGFAAYNGIAIWLPTYLAGPLAKGGAGVSPAGVAPYLFLFNVVGIVGFLSFGLLSTRFGRKKLYAVYAVLAAIGVIPYGLAHGNLVVLAVGVALLGFATTFFGAYGSATSELYATHVRGTALGFTFNTGRLIGGQAPILFGLLSVFVGLGAASVIVALPAALLTAVFFVMLPERHNLELESLDKADPGLALASG